MPTSPGVSLPTPKAPPSNNINILVYFNDNLKNDSSINFNTTLSVLLIDVSVCAFFLGVGTMDINRAFDGYIYLFISGCIINNFI